MLPVTFAADTCFFDVSQFGHTGNIVSVSKNCFCRVAETYFAAGSNVSRVAKLGNIEETCVRSRCYWQHVSSFC